MSPWRSFAEAYGGSAAQEVPRRSLLASEQMVGYWQRRYLSGSVTVEEMEVGVGCALAGDFTEEEWKLAAMGRLP